MSCDHPEILDYDIDDPVGTAKRYDQAIAAAVNSGSQAQLRELFSKFDSIASITGGAARAFTTVLGRPDDDPDSIDSTKRATLENSRDQLEAIAQVARDKRARITEFLEDENS